MSTCDEELNRIPPFSGTDFLNLKYTFYKKAIMISPVIPVSETFKTHRGSITCVRHISRILICIKINVDNHLTERPKIKLCKFNVAFKITPLFNPKKK